MNLTTSAPWWLVAILFALLLLAMLEDGWRLRISNALPIGIIGAAILAAILSGLSPSIWQNALLFIIALILGSLMFGARLLGGGDVKLFAVCLLWFDLRGAWQLVVAVAISGGVLALIILAARQFAGSPSHRWIVLQPKGGIPYGIAIAIGTAMMTVMHR
jgi:prepilin peptidase CpaA